MVIGVRLSLLENNSVLISNWVCCWILCVFIISRSGAKIAKTHLKFELFDLSLIVLQFMSIYVTPYHMIVDCREKREAGFASLRYNY